VRGFKLLGFGSKRRWQASFTHLDIHLQREVVNGNKAAGQSPSKRASTCLHWKEAPMSQSSLLHALHASPPLGTINDEYMLVLRRTGPVTTQLDAWSLRHQEKCGKVRHIGSPLGSNQICTTFPDPGYHHLSAVRSALQSEILASRVLPVFEENLNDFVAALRNGDSFAVNEYRKEIDKYHQDKRWFENLLAVPEMDIRKTVCGVLLEKYRPWIMKRVLSFPRIKAHDQVDDVINDVVGKALGAIQSYEPRALFPTWVARIADNTCIDVNERLQRSSGARLIIDPLDENDWFGGFENRDMIEKVKGVLSAEEYETLLAYFDDAISLGDIAKTKGVSISTAYRMIGRIIDKVRETLSDLDFPPDGKGGQKK
jgi:RNA polymerase sigma factor (sigma-70 family)